MFQGSGEIYVAILVFLMVVSIGMALVIFRAQKANEFKSRMVGTFEDDPFKEQKPGGNAFQAFLLKVGNFVSHGRTSTSLWEQMIQAGFLHPYAPVIYTGVKMLLFIVGLVLTTILVIPTAMMISTKIMTVFLGGVGLFFVPNFVILYNLKKRYDEICRYLPQAIDLLEICVSSGLGLDMAWNVVADEIHQVSKVLSGSMKLTNFEMHLGISRIEAMKHMAERTGVDELKSLAAILIQTDRFGTSIAETLQIFADALREERGFAAQEKAEKMSVKLLIPMILFIFPAVLVTMVGPAVIMLAKTL